ncbi:MAG: choice-of-anchor A family protein [Myxococcaceae bacterium]|nr:choice-of-anchor A family protein [Myxococcaceae bacterium]
MKNKHAPIFKTGHRLRALSLVVLASCGTAVEDAAPAQRRSALAACEVTPPFTPNFEPELQWQWTGSQILTNHKQVMMTPVVVELNGDGIPDVVFNSFSGNNYIDNGVMRAISGDDGHELWTVTSTSYEVRGAASIAAGDIDGDGEVELCTVPETGIGVICFNHDGSLKLRSTSSSASNWGGPSLADLDGDGTVEIIDGNTVYSNIGELKWRGEDGAGGPQGSGPLAFAVDIDQDSQSVQLELVNDRAIYKADGTLLCVNTTIGHGLAGVGNFDGDARGEVVVVWAGNVTLMDDNCQTLWTTALPGGGDGGPPTIADFDNDGQPEIGVAGSSAYSVLDTNGAVLWSSPTQDSSSRTGSSTFDFEGDGTTEVAYADETRLRIYAGASGQIRFEVAHSSGTSYENPVIADVDGDNSAEIIIASNNFAFPGEAGIRVFRDKMDGWVNTRRLWNQHAYFVTHVNDDGTIPAHPATHWLTPGLNSFRSNSQGGSPTTRAAADLVASNVGAWCDSASSDAFVSARVDNLGDVDVPAGLPVAFYLGNPASGGSLLGVAYAYDEVPAHSFTWVTLQHASVPGAPHEVWAVADDDGTGQGLELECLEDNNGSSASVSLTCSSCIEVRLNDYNLFLLENYSGGRNVAGKVAAGGNITMTDFSVGSGLLETELSNSLVAGGALSLLRGVVGGDAVYGGSYSGDTSVSYPRGTVTQGTPIGFASRFEGLRDLSTQLDNLLVNGTTTRESWGGVILTGTSATVNVFDMDSSIFTGANLLVVEAPAGSLVVVNIHGTSASFSAFGHLFSGGIDEHGILYNFVEATSLHAEAYTFSGTVLAPYADVTFSQGSWDGGLYAKSLTGNAEGYIKPLSNYDICQ